MKYNYVANTYKVYVCFIDPHTPIFDSLTWIKLPAFFICILNLFEKVIIKFNIFPGQIKWNENECQHNIKREKM